MRITHAGICILVTLLSQSISARDVEFPSESSKYFQCDAATTDDFRPAFVDNEWCIPAIERCSDVTEKTSVNSFEEFQRN